MHTRLQTRSSAAATALLLTASAAGLALTSGSAEAIGSHHAPTARAATLTVTITSTKGGPHLSLDRLRPGNTMFNIVRHGAGGTMQVLRLKQGYSLRHAFKDFAAAFPNNAPPDVAAVRSVYRNVVFYGGPGRAEEGPDQPLRRRHRQGRQVLRRQPRQEHADLVPGQGRPPEAVAAEPGGR